MTIYGRWGQEVTVVRTAVLADVELLTGTKPDQQDRDALKLGSYVVTQNVDTAKMVLHHLAFMRADGGAVEIGKATEIADTIHHLAVKYADSKMSNK